MQVFHEQFEVLVENRLGKDVKRYLVEGGEEALRPDLDGLLIPKLQTLHFELHDREVVRPPNRIFRQVVHERGVGLFRIVDAIESCRLDALFGQLCLDIERAQAVYLVAEEIQTVRVVMRVTVHVHDSASDGILARLIDEVHTLKAQFDKHVAQGRLHNLIALLDHHRRPAQGQRIRC